jgi:hypothetical protein
MVLDRAPLELASHDAVHRFEPVSRPMEVLQRTGPTESSLGTPGNPSCARYSLTVET